ncbi:hypothetical protein D3C71_1956530 [compost metagenome]
MAETRHHQQHLHALFAVADLRIHVEALDHRLEARFQLVERRPFLADEGEAHEEQAGFEIVELRTV